MKKVFLILLVILILLAILIAHKNSEPEIVISELSKKDDIKPGNLTYKISLLGVFPVGEAIFDLETIEQYAGRPVYHLKASAQSLSIISKFFSGSAILDSYVDIDKLAPLLFKQKIKVKDKKDIDKEISYDQVKNIMVREGVKRQILPNTQDPLSAIFNLRHMDFEKTKEFEFNLNTNQKNYILKGVSELKDIKVNKKVYKSVSIRAEINRRDKDNPYHKSIVSIVLLSEKGNIPLLIKVFASGFLINARLTEIN